MKIETRDILYLHLQASERFVISYGMDFREFAGSLNQSLQNLLMIRHQYEDGEFNINTLMDYVLQEDLPNLLKQNVNEYRDFCWTDFTEVSGLNELEGQEIAELLYLGHCKGHLKPPFYRQLQNQFVYLAHDDGWFNKIYYRSMDSFFEMLGNLIPCKMELLKREKSWLGGLRRKAEYGLIPSSGLKELTPLLTEGAAISFRSMKQTRNTIEIPIWILGDYVNMDDMLDEYSTISSEKPSAYVTFNRKTKEWNIER
ncbi:hypothetical protein JOC77_003663 [Peribacillus deserti]|uniref:Oxalate:formate antiporter n=1 Tax=Peribacillus deserti TaxID=673318 RepID=A0ABS2QNC3_9BACI|nr:hypothetical protein [Peribacillus deserti]MBM7694219.1 hypothetical protein [Peribacillus deserti]